MSEPIFEGCEWDPDEDREGFTDDEHNMTVGAVFSVGIGRNNWHLCAYCADLPRFRRFKKTPLPNRIAVRP